MKYKVDPTKITDYKRSDEELELFILFCVAVAGKTAKQISAALEKLLTKESYYLEHSWELKEFGGQTLVVTTCPSDASPFAKIRWLVARGRLEAAIRDSRLGQHRKLTHAFTEIAKSKLDLRKVTTDQLETIKGIGPKTSRFFILHSRRKQKVACLDTHQLKYLRDNGYPTAPKTLSKLSYGKWEKIYLDHAKSLGVNNIAEFDLKIWNSYSRK